MALREDSLTVEHYPYLSRRLPVLAQRGVVATSDPLAAQAGLRILQQGGNAVDAAIASAVALTVVEPTCNGVGGDAFAMVWDGARVHGINGSGKSPAAHNLELFRGLGLTNVPARGWLPVTVPGAPATWADLHRRFGRLPFEALFQPAIEYAEQGFPVGPITAQRWRIVAAIYAAECGADPALRPWGKAFTRDGRAPTAGETWALPDLAKTLRELARTGCESFYRGQLAERLSDFAAATGGYLTKRDLSAHESAWVEPISTNYRGYDVWEMPPNSPGLAALSALNVLEGFELSRYARDSVESYHLQLEAIKLGLADAHASVADPQRGDAWRTRLGKEHARAQRTRVSDVAMGARHRPEPRSSTVYLCTADADGMMVSFIQSNYSGWLLGFGSGVVVPDTGIVLHSRGCGFTLDEKHPNVIGPSKRPFHTLAPAFLSEGTRGVGPFGLVGGPIQTQAHVQFVVSQVDYGLNAQATLDAPRFQSISANRVEIELTARPELMQGLVARGHEVHPCVEFAAVPPEFRESATGRGGLLSSNDFGKAQLITRQKNGVYVAASDWRGGGCAVGY
jgi:gamma-glutamyltranspeptidase/glutathione hydrolase